MEKEYKSLVKYAKPMIMMPQTYQKSNTVSEKTLKREEESNISDILNSILPPREYTKDKKHLYIESVLSTPATSFDVIDLQNVS